MEQGPQSQDNQGEERNPPIVLHARLYKEGNTTSWALDYDPDPPRNSKAVIDLREKPGGHRIIFNLVKAPGVRFDTRGPIWVVEDGPCPPPAGATHSQIRVQDCNDHKLVIYDSNDKACDLIYQLNFIGEKGLDPMIRNGGEV